MTSQPFDIQNLSTDERLRLLEELWDSLRPEDLPLTPAQKAELDRRLEQAERDGWTGIPWEQVLAKLTT